VIALVVVHGDEHVLRARDRRREGDREEQERTRDEARDGGWDASRNGATERPAVLA